MGLMFILGIMSCSSDYDPDLPLTYGDPDSIAFNEVHSTGNPDWIELYNYGNAEVDLKDWMVFDQEENMYVLFPYENIVAGILIFIIGFIIAGFELLLDDNIALSIIGILMIAGAFALLRIHKSLASSDYAHCSF